MKIRPVRGNIRGGNIRGQPGLSRLFPGVASESRADRDSVRHGGSSLLRAGSERRSTEATLHFQDFTPFRFRREFNPGQPAEKQGLG
jgi:hypothetical protein